MDENNKRLTVIAFGGNALIHSDEEGHFEEQVRNAEMAIESIAPVLEQGEQLVIVHGNGPQVGQELLRQEEASTKLPAMPLDACVANTQGCMGYLLERSIRNYLIRQKSSRKIATLLSLVAVDSQDSAFGNPTKPVGPFYTPYRARQLIREKGWTLVEDSGRGFRTVVASPMPLKVFGLEAAHYLLGAGYIVIMGGGGGIPVANDSQGESRGLEAVIDKDLTAALIACQLDARRLVMLTEVDYVSIDFATPQQRDLTNVTLEEIHMFHKAGHFPPGSMGPKVEAAMIFLENGGNEVLISSTRCLPDALKNKGGTKITNPNALDGSNTAEQFTLKL